MQERMACLVLFSATIAATLVYHPASPSAKTAEGYKGSVLAVGRLGKSDAFSSFAQTKEASDVYVQRNVWAPGGSTGWHTHPGPSLIIVTAGTVTDYEGHDPDCKPHVYTQGMSFVDEGGSHVHIIRNEGSGEASTIAIQLIPVGAARRIDSPTAPPNCSNIQ